MRLAMTVALLGTLLPFTQAAAAPAKAKLLVMRSKPAQGITADSAALLDEIIMSELSKDPRFDVVGEAEVMKLIQVESLKQQVGCDSDSCLAEIGGALGAEYLVSATLGRLGDSFVVSLKLMRLRNAQVQRWTETVPAKEDALVDGVRRSVHAILPVEAGQVGRHRWSYVALGTGGALAGAGGIVGYLAWSEAKARNLAVRDPTEYAADNSSAGHLVTGANALWGVAATAVVSGAVLWIIEARH